MKWKCAWKNVKLLAFQAKKQLAYSYYIEVLKDFNRLFMTQRAFLILCLFLSHAFITSAQFVNRSVELNFGSRELVLVNEAKLLEDGEAFVVFGNVQFDDGQESVSSPFAAKLDLEGNIIQKRLLNGCGVLTATNVHGVHQIGDTLYAIQDSSSHAMLIKITTDLEFYTCVPVKSVDQRFETLLMRPFGAGQFVVAGYRSNPNTYHAAYGMMDMNGTVTNYQLTPYFGFNSQYYDIAIKEDSLFFLTKLGTNGSDSKYQVLSCFVDNELIDSSIIEIEHPLRITVDQSAAEGFT